jgi:hypothetical protein
MFGMSGHDGASRGRAMKRRATIVGCDRIPKPAILF